MPITTGYTVTIRCENCEEAMHPMYSTLGDKYYMCANCGAEVSINLNTEDEG